MPALPRHLPAVNASQLRLGADLRSTGVDPAREQWVQVRRGVWLPAAAWNPLTPGQRHATRVLATALLIEPEAVFCQAAAAAMWGLPRIEAWPSRIDVLSTKQKPRSSSQLSQHTGRGCVPSVLNGIRVTPVARTIIDLARWHSLETAVSAADHALRERLCTLDDLVSEAADLPPRSKGRPMARLAADLADPAAESPGESLSRVQMFRHNLPRPRLQVPLGDERGVFGRGDFGWGEDVIGEFDGKWKYRVPPGTGPSIAVDALWREKQREDRIRRSGKRVARWLYRDAVHGRPMVAILARAGIRAVTPRAWFDLGENIRGA